MLTEEQMDNIAIAAEKFREAIQKLSGEEIVLVTYSLKEGQGADTQYVGGFSHGELKDTDLAMMFFHMAGNLHKTP